MSGFTRRDARMGYQTAQAVARAISGAGTITERRLILEMGGRMDPGSVKKVVELLEAAGLVRRLGDAITWMGEMEL